MGKQKTDEHSRFVEFWLDLFSRRETKRGKTNKQQSDSLRQETDCSRFFHAALGISPLLGRSMIFQHRN